MIWATVSSQTCFCWLFRASPSLAAKNIINIISVLNIWWCPCVESSHVFGRGFLLWTVWSLGKTLLAFALLHFVLQGQIFMLIQVSLDFLLLHSNPLWWKGHFFLVLFLKSAAGLHRTKSTSASSTLVVGAYTWITVILNGYPLKRTKIILSFLRLHPSTAFQTLLLIMRGTSFLLWESCQQ